VLLQARTRSKPCACEARLGVWRRGQRIASTPAPVATLNLPGRPAQTTLLHQG
jgi:cytosine deaminase